MRSKAGVASKALISQPECSATKGVAEHVIKKKKRHNLIFVRAQNCALQSTVDLAADSRWEDKKTQQYDLVSPAMRHLES